MDKAFATAVMPTLSAKKASARVALVDMKEPGRSVLAECFRQFGIETVALNGDSAERLKKEKFEACVIKLGPTAHDVMDSARTSPSNSRMVLYAVGGEPERRAVLRHAPDVGLEVGQRFGVRALAEMTADEAAA